MAKINQCRIKEYAKINLDTQFILPHERPDGSTKDSSDENANTDSSTPIDVETVSHAPTAMNDFNWLLQ